MSLKPIKKSDIKKLEKMQARKREVTKIELPPKILIVTEGTKTEPYYFNILAEKIYENTNKLSRNKRVIVKVEGTGRNTNGLYNHLESNYDSDELAEYDQIWLVYDKDDFPKDRFDNAAFKAESKKNTKFKVAWSNQSFELWLLWHYQDFTANCHRDKYIENLNKHVPNYDKGQRAVYEKIIAEGDIKKAIKRAEKQKKHFESIGETAPSKMPCASMVYKLVKELIKYIK